MFKKLNQYLLINQPLIWNLKAVPLAGFLLVCHLIFFILGYINGAIDFEKAEMYGSDYIDGFIIFFSILICILTLVVWLVYYFKNNGFKSYYPKSKFALFKEWILLLLLSFLLSSFSISYFAAKDLRVRSYFTEQEAELRCEVLALASIFTDGSFEHPGYKTVDSAGYQITVMINSFDYRGRSYPLTSLVNKNTQGFQFFDRYEDSLMRKRVRDWLHTGEKDSVYNLLKKFEKIADEHHLKGNISAKQWLDIVYKPPVFDNDTIVADSKGDDLYDEQYSPDVYYERGPQVLDSTNQYVEFRNGKQYTYNRYYVPENELHHSYGRVAESWTSPMVDMDFVTGILCCAFALALLIFAFRITSGRAWLIAVLGLGVISIIFGIISAILSSEYIFLTMLILLFIVLVIYFFVVLTRNKGKGWSDITLNAMLWMLPGFIPALYTCAIEVVKRNTGYYDRGIDYIRELNTSPQVTLLEDNVELMIILNLVFVFLAMILLTVKIQQWKGVAEN
jgi:hypothetical protein